MLKSHETDNVISTTIYKKPTHTDRYLQFDLHHPKHHRFAVAKTLHKRIDTHVTNSDDKATLHKQMQHTLTLNGFPRRFSCLALKKSHVVLLILTSLLPAFLIFMEQQTKFNVF